MARQLTTLERVILTALDTDPPATMAELRACTGEKQSALVAAIRGLRWRGMIAMDRLALNRPTQQAAEPAPEPEPAVPADPPPAADASPAGQAERRRETLVLPAPEPATVFVYPARPARAEKPAIGAVEPLPSSWSRTAWAVQRRMQGADARRAAGDGVTAKIAQREIEKRAADAARLADPLEQAKTRLRRRGFTVFAAEVTGGPEGKFYVGGRLMTEAELLAKAG